MLDDAGDWSVCIGCIDVKFLGEGIGEVMECIEVGGDWIVGD